MRSFLAIAAVAAMIPTFAAAQPANRDANTPAVNTRNSPPNPGAPAAGANSFTEGQAKSRIEGHGYASVSGLRKDDQGVLARHGHEGRQERQRQPRFPRQRDRAVAVFIASSPNKSNNAFNNAGLRRPP